jgi:hypothetical protein
MLKIDGLRRCGVESSAGKVTKTIEQINVLNERYAD